MSNYGKLQEQDDGNVHKEKNKELAEKTKKTGDQHKLEQQELTQQTDDGNVDKDNNKELDEKKKETDDQHREREREKKKKKKKKREQKESREKTDKSLRKILDIFEKTKTNEVSLDDAIKRMKDLLSIDSSKWNTSWDVETKKTALENIKNELQLNKKLLKHGELEPREVIAQSPILAGKYLTRDVNDWMQQRRSIVCVNGDVQFKSPSIPGKDETEEFDDKEKKDFFEKSLETSGWSFAIHALATLTANVGLGGGYGFSKQKEKEKEKIENTSKYQYNKTTYCIVPVVLWESDFSQLSFTNSALEALQKLESMLPQNIDLSNTLAENFFKEFGSHIYVGNANFGGTFKTETTYESERSTTKDLVKNLVNDAHSTSLHLLFNVRSVEAQGSLSYTNQSGKGENEGKLTEKEKYTIKHSISKLGGPQEVNILEFWKLGLINNNRTWVVIDAGKATLKEGRINSESYFGVWNLVQKEESKFINASNLSRFLMERWEHLTQSKATDSYYADTSQILSTKRKFQTFIHNMNILQEEPQPKAIVELFKELYRRVKEMDKIAISHKIWPTELTENANLHFLLKTVQSIELSRADRFEVADTIEELLFLAGNTDYPQKQDLINWLGLKEQTFSAKEESIVVKKGITTVEDFLQFLSVTFYTNIRTEQLNKTTEIRTKLLEKTTSDLAAALFDMLNKFQSENDVFSYTFLLALFVRLDFDVCSHVFASRVTVERFTDFVDKSSGTLQRYKEFKTRNDQVRQACAFHTLAKIVNEIGKAAMYFYTIVQHVNKTFSQLDSCILNLTGADLDVIMRSLCGVIDGSLSGKNILCWEYFEHHSIEFNTETNDTVEADPDIPEQSFAFNLLQCLGLREFFPRKLSMQSALSIRDNNFTDVTDVLQIPWVVLWKIVSVNFEFREVVLKQFVIQVSKNDEIDDDDDLFSCFNSKNIIERKGLVDNVHPLDMFLIIFQCCDPFLQRLVVQKINECKLAVPLIYPDLSDNNLRMSLWSLRDVFIDKKSECVSTLPLKTVAFLRIGEGLSISKSRTINRFLRDADEEHATFFHRDLEHGMNKRKVSKGMIEATWFIPSTEEQEETRNCTEKINEPLTILNLRGDGLKFHKQKSALLMLSNIVVVLITYVDLEKPVCLDNLKQVITSGCSCLILTDVALTQENIPLFYEYANSARLDKNKVRIISTFDKIKGEQRNQHKLRNTMTKIICQLLKNVHEGIVLEKKLQQLDIRHDESIKCINAKTKADQIFQNLRHGGKMSSNKGLTVPLQGDALWIEWSKKQKDTKRPKNQTSYQTEETLLKSMKEIRLKQVEACNKASPVIALFVHILAETINDSEATQYFIIWLRQAIDNQSRIEISEISDQFSATFKLYDSRSKEKKTELDRIEKELVQATFGMEHFFREIGQIYEAFMSSQDDMQFEIAVKTLSVLNKMPIIAAKALLLGQPLEILDGDAANVPLRWVKSVFEALQQLIGDKKLCAVSVLGVQSSGKSTLLNTMFGLRFAVSAGHCTRGIYAQLIPADRKRSALKCDYVLVLDTEGLRSPELAGEKLRHDNELATLVIGLSDLVLINIKGEAISDMENVLEIVVHGLIRLTQANTNLSLHQSCMFIHQNVSVQDGDKIMTQGNKKIVENLDDITKEVAHQENINNVSSFRDVIKFDPTKDIRYIPDLRKSKHTMAPASPQYSKAVTDVANCIVQFASQDKKFFSSTNMFLHVESLWQGILAEDFVFSFRNCLEVKAYTLLESEYQKLSSKLDMLKLQWITDNLRPNLCKLTQIDDLESTTSEMIHEFNAKLDNRHSDVEVKLIKYIEESDLKTLMVQWQTHKIECMRNKVETIKQETRRKIYHEKENYSRDIRNSNFIVTKEKEINKRAKMLALTFEGQEVDKKTIENKFNALWITWFNELAPEFPADVTSTDTILTNELITILKEKFERNTHLINKLGISTDLGNWPSNKTKLLHSMNARDIHQYISKGGFVSRSKNVLPEVSLNPVLNLLNSIFENIDAKFDYLLKLDCDYDKSVFSGIVDDIRVGIETFNAEQNTEFQLTPVFEISVAHHVAKFAFEQFRTLNRQYAERHGLQTKLLNYKPTALMLFMDICQAKSHEIIVTNMLCSEIKSLIKEKNSRSLPVRIQNEITSRYYSQKHSLMRQIMTELAKGKDFKTYISYIQNPSVYVLKWITKKTNTIVFETKDSLERSLYVKWTSEDLDNLIHDINKAVRFASHKCESQTEETTGLADWRSAFIDKLKGKGLLLADNSFSHVTDYSVSNFQELTDVIVGQLYILKKELHMELKMRNPEEFQWEDKTPYEYIFDRLWGCKEKCPFCSEPCQKSEPNHVSSNDCHICIQHRPIGLTGMNWKDSHKLAIESCNFNVQSEIRRKCGRFCGCSDTNCEVYHPFKDYKKYVNDWDIAPKSDISASVYWNWFMASFYREISDYYGTELPDIPDSWKTITMQNAIDSLVNVYIT